MMHIFGPIWTAPIVLGVLTIVGLVSALVGDGVWDALSALALGVVVAVGAWFGLRRPKKRHGARG
jgi:O-antigen/teichoic acid export membrane protein